jgi:hypothetical protein
MSRRELLNCYVCSEIARAAAGGSDEDFSVTAAHNVTMVMDYLQNVMTGTRLNAFFLSMDDQIDANWPIPIPVSKPAPIPLGLLLEWYRGPAFGHTDGPSLPNCPSSKAQPRQIWPIADALTHNLETILRSSVQGCSIGDPLASEMRWKAQLEKRGKIAIRRHEDEVEVLCLISFTINILILLVDCERRLRADGRPNRYG